MIEKILDEKVDKEWNAIYLENQYLKIMILPELGGRVQMAYDKTKERHFIYYNQVINPALVGLIVSSAQNHNCGLNFGRSRNI